MGKRDKGESELWEVPVLNFIAFDRVLLKYECKDLASACFYFIFFNWYSLGQSERFSAVYLLFNITSLPFPFQSYA